jgi:hypothetical protein
LQQAGEALGFIPRVVFSSAAKDAVDQMDYLRGRALCYLQRCCQIRGAAYAAPGAGTSVSLRIAAAALCRAARSEALSTAVLLQRAAL